MKKEELMIGDWYWWEAEGKKYPMQVTEKTFALLDEDVWNFEPIPITPEILTEKLDFAVQNEKNLIYNLRIEDKRLLFPDNIKMRAIVKTHYKEHPKGQYEFIWILDCPWIESLKIQYIHELQHAIKLCKIEKEIIL